MDNGYERRGVKITLDKIKVFCMPHAGASASVYYKWEELLNEWKFELIPIEYQGHGIRADEDFYEDFDSMMEDVYEQVVEKLGESSRYVIFGHSMGSRAAYEMYKRLWENGKPLPRRIIFSGCLELSKLTEDPDLLNEHEFREEYIKLGGISDEVLACEELAERIAETE